MTKLCDDNALTFISNLKPRQKYVQKGTVYLVRGFSSEKVVIEYSTCYFYVKTIFQHRFRDIKNRSKLTYSVDFKINSYSELKCFIGRQHSAHSWAPAQPTETIALQIISKHRVKTIMYSSCRLYVIYTPLNDVLLLSSILL